MTPSVLLAELTARASRSAVVRVVLRERRVEIGKAVAKLGRRKAGPRNPKDVAARRTRKVVLHLEVGERLLKATLAARAFDLGGVGHVRIESTRGAQPEAGQMERCK